MRFRWGEFDTVIMSGPIKISPDVYHDETPWACVQDDNFVVCVPWQNKDGSDFEIGVKFTDIVKGYLFVLKENIDEGVNNSDDILVAIRDLSEIIKLLSETQTVKKPEALF